MTTTDVLPVSHEDDGFTTDDISLESGANVRGIHSEKNSIVIQSYKKLIGDVSPACRKDHPNKSNKRKGQEDDDGESINCCKNNCFLLRHNKTPVRQQAIDIPKSSENNNLTGPSRELTKKVVSVSKFPDPEVPPSVQEKRDKNSEDQKRSLKQSTHPSSSPDTTEEPLKELSLEDILLSYAAEPVRIEQNDLEHPPPYLDDGEFAQQEENDAETPSMSTSVTRIMVIMDEKRKPKDRFSLAIKEKIATIRKRLVGGASAAAAAVSGSPRLFYRRPTMVIVSEHRVEAKKAVRTEQLKEEKETVSVEMDTSQPEEKEAVWNPEANQNELADLASGNTEVLLEQRPQLQDVTKNISESEAQDQFIEHLPINEPQVREKEILIQPEPKKPYIMEHQEAETEEEIKVLGEEIQRMEGEGGVVTPSDQIEEAMGTQGENQVDESLNIGRYTAEEIPILLKSGDKTYSCSIEPLFMPKKEGVQTLDKDPIKVSTKTKKVESVRWLTDQVVKLGELVKTAVRLTITSAKNGSKFVRRATRRQSKKPTMPTIGLVTEHTEDVEVKDRLRQQDREIWLGISKQQLRAAYATIQTSISKTAKEKLMWLGTLHRILVHKAVRSNVDDPVRNATLDGNIILTCLKILDEATETARESKKTKCKLEKLEEAKAEVSQIMQVDNQTLTMLALQVLQESALNDVGVMLFKLYEGSMCVTERLRSLEIIENISDPLMARRGVEILKIVFALLFTTCGKIGDCSEKWRDSGIVIFSKLTLQVTDPQSPYITDPNYVGLALGTLRVLASRGLLKEDEVEELVDIAVDKLISYSGDTWINENAMALIALIIMRCSSITEYLNTKYDDIWKLIIQRCKITQSQGHVMYQGLQVLKEACLSKPDVIIPRVVEAGGIQLVEGCLPPQENKYIENLLPTAIKLKQIFEPYDFENEEIQNYLRSKKHGTDTTTLVEETSINVSNIQTDMEIQKDQKEGNMTMFRSEQQPLEVKIEKTLIQHEEFSKPQEEEFQALEPVSQPVLNEEHIKSSDDELVEHTLQIANTQRQITPRTGGHLTPLSATAVMANQEPIDRTSLGTPIKIYRRSRRKRKMKHDDAAQEA